MKTDKDCWEYYKKYNWVYNRINLFNAQNIKWTPYPFNDYIGMNVFSVDEMPTDLNAQYPTIYANLATGTDRIFAEIVLARGELKSQRITDINLQDVDTSNMNGNMELKINAFVTKYFGKHTGVLFLEFLGNDIISVSLYPHLQYTDTSITKILNKLP